jgi:cytochrome o ubiquinol oxidase subunit 2
VLKRHKITVAIAVALCVVLVIVYVLRDYNFAILNPRGIIAERQRQLIVFTTLLGLLVIIPVFILTFWVAWRYRESNTSARYTPDWDRNLLFESLWWGIPTIIIAILSVVIWQSSHELDPYRQIASNNKPITIQVVALQWKWLFIYPEQHIATINYVQFPKDTPVNFQLTADAPMNSFWIPQLGGQMYAMAGMTTHLNLMADQTGNFRGSSANISGRGFSGMNFVAHASSDSDFKIWVNQVKQSQNQLNSTSYARLSKPSIGGSNAYTYGDTGLYDTVLLKYMSPGTDAHAMHMEEQ